MTQRLRYHVRARGAEGSPPSFVMNIPAARQTAPGSALGFELRQVRGGCFDLSLIQCCRDGSHAAGRGRLPLGACLEFVEPTDDKLRGFSRNTRKASTVTFAIRAMTAEASPHVRRAFLGELLSREHAPRCG